jgi:hypothetical protein
LATDKTEKQEIKRFGGVAQKNSGRGKHGKGDATLGPFTVDVKEFSKTFGLSRAVWSKVSADAAKNGNEPSLMVALGEGQGTLRLWVIQEDMFIEMYEAWEEKYGG